MLTEEALQVIRRMMPRGAMLELWPDGKKFFTACQCPYSKNEDEHYIYCTRPKNHAGPHIDYHVYTKFTGEPGKIVYYIGESDAGHLIWEVTRDD